MTLNLDRVTRRHALEHQIRRLEPRLATLKRLSNRVSWVRVTIVAIGLSAAYALAVEANAAAGWLALALTGLVFAGAVLYHRHLERWLKIFMAARDLRADQLARLALDWENIPGPAPLDGRVKNSLALDLDLIGRCSIHQLIDTTLTRQGSQLLADWLTRADPEPEPIQARQRLVRELVPLTRFRDRFLLTARLFLKEQLEGQNLLEWLNVDFPSRRLTWALPVAAMLVILNLTLFAMNAFSIVPPFWVLTTLVYFAFYYFNQAPLADALEALTRLDAELDKFSALLKYLETSPCLARGSLAELCAPFRSARHRPSAQLRRIKLGTFAVGLRSNPLLGFILNLVLPWDFIFAFLASRYRDRVAHTLPAWVDVVYRLDALVALANFAHLNPEYVFPEITPGTKPIFQAEGLGHPLIPFEHRVCNDFAIDTVGELGIITGSNMAGKSTFVRTVGVNLCLAYAGAPVNASRFRSLPFRLYTCIRIGDSVVDGFSYFYAEVKCLKGLLNELRAESPWPLLYLIDEIFRGTNNRERLLGSRAYVRALLGAHGSGLLATHDLELAGLAQSNLQAHNYHFRDQVLDGKLVFDYKIRPGPSPTTNALKIMQMEGLPVEPEGQI